MIDTAEATRRVAALSDPDQGERELKFTLPAGRVDAARRWLDVACRRDEEFPAAIVWTLYYDSPDLHALGEKLNSDYLKRKVRLRWYSDLDGVVTGPAFVEMKARVGNRRLKRRAVLPVPAAEIAASGIEDSRVAGYPALLRSEGVALPAALQPVLLLRYRRDRFYEPFSGTRISLDSDIRVVEVNRRVMAPGDFSPLTAGVLEVKGRREDLPPALRPLLQFGLRLSSFSKYLAVYAHVTRATF